MNEEFHEAINAAVQKHAHNLDADDIRDEISHLDRVAEKWELLGD